MSQSPVEPYALYAVSLQGQTHRLTTSITLSGALGDVNPVCSPDGKTVAFTRNTRTLLDGELYLLGLTGTMQPAGEPRAVWWAGTGIALPLWSHGGRELIFQRQLQRNLWRVDATEQGPPRPVRLGVNGIDNPATSADGRAMVFSQGTHSPDVIRVELTSGKLEPVIASSSMDIGSELSPDGRRIVFGSKRSGSREIWIAAADGSDPVQVSRLKHDLTGSPHWSPDGKWIAFDSRVGGKARLYLTTPEGAPVRQLLNGTADDAVPRWSRDGKWLYFSSTRSGAWEAWKVNTTDFTNPQQITHAGGVGPVESPDGKFLYYGKGAIGGGAHQVWRMKTAGGPEEQLLRDFSIVYEDFLPLNDGLYFVPQPEGEKRTMLFLDFATGKTKRLGELAKGYVCCLDISKDRRHMYFTAEADSGQDLMIVRNFR